MWLTTSRRVLLVVVLFVVYVVLSYFGLLPAKPEEDIILLWQPIQKNARILSPVQFQELQQFIKDSKAGIDRILVQAEISSQYDHVEWNKVLFAQHESNMMHFCTDFLYHAHARKDTELLLPKINISKLEIFWDEPFSVLQSRKDVCIVASGATELIAVRNALRRYRPVPSLLIGDCDGITKSNRHVKGMVEWSRKCTRDRIIYDALFSTSNATSAHKPNKDKPSKDALWYDDAFAVPVLLTFQNAYAVADGFVFNDKLVYKTAGFCMGYPELWEFQNRTASLAMTKVAQEPSKRVVNKIIHLGAIWANKNLFHAVMNGVVRIIPHLDEVINDPEIHILITGEGTDFGNIALIILELLGVPNVHQRVIFDYAFAKYVFMPVLPYDCFAPHGPKQMWLFRDYLLHALGFPTYIDTLFASSIHRKVALKQPPHVETPASIVVFERACDQCRRRERNINNFKELLHSLQQAFPKETFMVVRNVSVHESIALWRSMATAKAVIAAHGTGLTNMIFLRPGTPILEFQASDYVNWCHLKTARVLSLPFTSIVSNGTNYKGLVVDTQQAVSWLRYHLLTKIP